MKSLIPLLLHVLLSFSSPYAVVSLGGRCPDCGGTHVPYPLSTHPGCGDPSYKLRCDGHTLWLDTLNASSYPITSIHPETQRFIVRPPGLAAGDTCVSRDFKTQGMWLDTNAPFNITSSNTLILMNCSQEVLSLLWNCSSSSLCYRYVAADRVVGPACGGRGGGGAICCTIKTGGSTTEYRIRVRKERCAAYVSFPNLDESAPMSEWPEPGVEIEWELPEEPVCVAAADCVGLGNSVCLSVPPGRGGGRRCLCNSGFQWDPVNGICQEIKCVSGRRCKLRNKKKIQLIGGFVFAGVAMLAGTLISTIISLRRRRHRRSQAQLSTSMARDILNGDKSCKVFTIKEITKATDNFAKHNLLGSGGFGEVFKGVLEDGTVTAIKRARLGSTRAIDQLLNEVRILCQVNHRHLVRLLGCCLDLADEPFLVYEFVPNGTLFDCLHRRVDADAAAKWAPLTWHQRLRIAHQTAQGLAYLHDACVPRIFHRDVKSSNILLDNNLDAKVSDFGVSRLATSEATHVTTCAQGTLGYLDPEYYINFQVTDKSDVYSLGVVLLEMLTAKKALDFGREEEDVNLVVFVKRAMRNGRLMDVIDPTVRNGAGRMEVESIKALGCLAEACLDDRRQNRPSMKQVADEIQYILTLLNTTTHHHQHPPNFQVSCHDNGDFEIFSATDPLK